MLLHYSPMNNLLSIIFANLVFLWPKNYKRKKNNNLMQGCKRNIILSFSLTQCNSCKAISDS